MDAAVHEPDERGDEVVHLLQNDALVISPAVMHGQVAGSGAVRFGSEQFARVRPLNDVAYAGATKILAREWKQARGRAGIEPRVMVFLANVAAIGVLTMKGMVESLGDPLILRRAARRRPGADLRGSVGVLRLAHPARTSPRHTPEPPRNYSTISMESAYRARIFFGSFWPARGARP